MAYATLTVSQLRTLVNAIPTNRNASLIVIIDDTAPLPVVTNYVDGPDGAFYTVQGYINLFTKQFVAVP